MSLTTYKKRTLKEMCQKLNLNDEGLKSDLEDRLQDYLDTTGLSVEDVPELSDHFIELPISPSTARKGARKTMEILGDVESDLETKATQMLRPVSKRLEDAANEMEVSPAKVAQWADETKKRVLRAKHLPTTLTKSIPEQWHAARTALGTTAGVAALSVIAEGFKMTKALVPISYEVKLAGLRSITVPDIMVFFSIDNYWKPVLTWLLFQLIPLAISAVINLRASSQLPILKRSRSSKSSFDPFTFAVAKLLMVYLAFQSSVSFSSLAKQVTIVKYVVGLDTFVIGTTITLLSAIYVAALQN